MNRNEARDVINGHASLSWAAALQALGLTGEIRYQGVAKEQPAQGKIWSRVSFQTVDEYQETLKNGDARRWVTVGIIYVQIMVPRTLGTAQVISDKLAELVRNDFRDRNVEEHLEFTAAAIDDNVAPEPSWLVVNVTTRFWYRQFI